MIDTSQLRHLLAVVGLSSFLLSCRSESLERVGALVPPTADQDPSLPQLTVTVAGHRRALHLQTFGSPQQPVAFVLPGGPGADFRLLLPLKALSDHYYVVMWDPRGAGLSERVSRAELTIDSYVDEIDAVKKALSPGRPVTLIGHSFGAMMSLRYAARHPQQITQLVLIEPGPITDSGRKAYNGGSVNWLDGQDFFWQNQLLTSSDHATADYKAISLLPGALRTFTCTGDRLNEPLWRFGAYQYYVLTQTSAGAGDDDWLAQLPQFTGPVLILAGTCGAARTDFQRLYNLPVLPGATLDTIPGAGHITLFLNYSGQTLQRLRTALLAYQ
ncbi:alpha/beta hydrolase [Fibrella sp. HMF5335]|uniref:Alpha/beta hydrolase n=1 Tax=Fibrella rubiginis TaxID=2817060 RepID=A0A939GKR7_9BACT|nr:alpha/beta hydrolase [Fibrella rubiginis]MBO0938625.1 alpha/beta hydrolase [Fibrella rubiginis]